MGRNNRERKWEAEREKILEEFIVTLKGIIQGK